MLRMESLNFCSISRYECVDQNSSPRRCSFAIALIVSLFFCIPGGVYAATFDLLPKSMFTIEVTGDISTPNSITIAESMQPSFSELMSSSGATGFNGYIFNTEVYQSENPDTGFAIPQSCAGPGNCGLLSGIVECICAIDLPEGSIVARDGNPVTIAVTDTSRHFRFVNNFSTIGVMTNVGFLPFDLHLTVDISDGLSIELISSGPYSASATATPIPAALPLFASGLGALGLLGWRRKQKAVAA